VVKNVFSLKKKKRPVEKSKSKKIRKPAEPHIREKKSIYEWVARRMVVVGRRFRV
jgi:hypothetical protein